MLHINRMMHTAMAPRSHLTGRGAAVTSLDVSCFFSSKISFYELRNQVGIGCGIHQGFHIGNAVHFHLNHPSFAIRVGIHHFRRIV